MTDRVRTASSGCRSRSIFTTTRCSAENCYIGSDANPIVLNLAETPTNTPVTTTGGPGGNALINTGIEVADNPSPSRELTAADFLGWSTSTPPST